MNWVRIAVIVQSILGSVALGILVALIRQGPDTPQVWVSATSAAIAILAFSNSILTYVLAEARARFTNSFAIARKWDEALLLDSRKIMREHHDAPDFMTRNFRTDKSVELAVVHLVNFYWDMAAAIETGWAASKYLRLRFSETLQIYYPPMQALLEWRNENRPKAERSRALESIDKLRGYWGIRE